MSQRQRRDLEEELQVALLDPTLSFSEAEAAARAAAALRDVRRATLRRALTVAIVQNPEAVRQESGVGA